MRNPHRPRNTNRPSMTTHPATIVPHLTWLSVLFRCFWSLMDVGLGNIWKHTLRRCSDRFVIPFRGDDIAELLAIKNVHVGHKKQKLVFILRRFKPCGYKLAGCIVALQTPFDLFHQPQCQIVKKYQNTHPGDHRIWNSLWHSLATGVLFKADAMDATEKEMMQWLYDCLVEEPAIAHLWNQ